MKALVIGGTGPTGPFIVNGLLARGYQVTIYHRGTHEIDFSGPVEHLHGDAPLRVLPGRPKRRSDQARRGRAHGRVGRKRRPGPPDPGPLPGGGGRGIPAGDRGVGVRLGWLREVWRTTSIPSKC